MLLDVNRGEHVVTHEALGQDDGVLVVEALPWHERHEQVLAECQLPIVGGRAVGQEVASLDVLTFFDERLLVDTSVLVGALELRERVDPAPELGTEAVLCPGPVLDRHVLACDFCHGPVALGHDDLAGITRRACLNAGADVWRFGHEERDGLLLHVGAHERAVCVVVLDKGDEGGRDRQDLLRRDVHEVDLCRRHEVDFARGPVRRRRGADAHTGALWPATNKDALFDKAPGVVELGRRLRDDVLLFLVSGEVDDLVCHLALDDLAVRGLDEAVLVHPGVRREVADEPDVRAFRRLDRAHAPVVGRVNVTNLEACPFPRQAPWPESREAALVGKPRQRVVLVHELTQLAGPEELLDGSDHGADVDQGLRRDRLDVLGRHALAHHPLHTGQADADLVLDQLADRADAAVGEVVLVVESVARLAVREVEHVGRGCEHLRRAEDALVR